MNKTLLKDALALTIITLVAGCLLGLVQMITAKPIAQQKEKTKQEAYKTVYPDGKEFVKVDGADPSKDAKKALKKDGLDASNTIEEILAARDARGKQTGYVMTVTNAEGYGGDITFTMGVKNDGTVTGIQFTAIDETAGLGMKAKEPVFRKQFSNKKVKQFAYTKSGAKKENEIDALSGATITTNAVTNGVNAGLSYFRYATGGGVDE